MNILLIIKEVKSQGFSSVGDLFSAMRQHGRTFTLGLVRILPSQFIRFLFPSMLIAPLTLQGVSALARPQADADTKPATTQDLFLYRALGSSYLCNARAAGVEFPKAVAIAATTYVQVLTGRHGGFVNEAGDKKLTNKQLFSGAEFQVITGALQYCPKQVPKKVKKKVESALKKEQRRRK